MVFGIAIIPGFMNAFLIMSLHTLIAGPKFRYPRMTFPVICILVAAYNEQDCIASTIESIAAQGYPGPLQVIVINDGSTDDTARVLAGLRPPVVAGHQPADQRGQGEGAESRA